MYRTIFGLLDLSSARWPGAVLPPFRRRLVQHAFPPAWMLLAKKWWFHQHPPSQQRITVTSVSCENKSHTFHVCCLWWLVCRLDYLEHRRGWSFPACRGDGLWLLLILTRIWLPLCVRFPQKYSHGSIGTEHLRKRCFYYGCEPTYDGWLSIKGCLQGFGFACIWRCWVQWYHLHFQILPGSKLQQIVLSWLGWRLWMSSIRVEWVYGLSIRLMWGLWLNERWSCSL